MDDDAPLVPIAPPLVTIPDVELCAVGTWHASTGVTTFTREDLAACIAAMDCPGVRNPVLKLGHAEEDGAGLRWDGEPTIGWIGNMRLGPDDAKIIGDYTGMPGWLASILPSAYPDRSIEMYRPFKCQIGHSHPAVITAVALLGVAPPAVGVLQSLQDVAALYQVQTAAPVQAVAVRHGNVVYLATTTPEPEPPERRAPTALETASGVDPDAIQESWQSALDDLIEAWAPITTAWRADLSEQIRDLVDQAELVALAAMELPVALAETVLRTAMLALAEIAAGQMAAEAASQGVQVAAPDVDDEHLGEIASSLAELMARWLAGAAGREALRRATADASGDDVAAAVDEHLAALSDRFVREQLGGALSAAQASGRFGVLDQAPDAQYAASEVLDAGTCKPCKEIDEHVFESLAEAKAHYLTGGFINCEGRLRCRGIIVALWPDTAAAAPPGPARHPVRLLIGGPSHGDQSVRLRIH